MKDSYPNTKEIVYLLGIGVLLSASIFMPGLGYAAVKINRFKRKREWQKSLKAWDKFNLHKLKRNLQRLRLQKVVEVAEIEEEPVVKLTEKGSVKFLKFKLQRLSLEGQKWDGKWRLVMYDIPKHNKNIQSAFRNVLKYIQFLKLQKSVYLTPYPCEEQIIYLREYFNIGDNVILIRADQIENEQVYKRYFGL